MQRLGSQVTLIERGERILKREDSDISEEVERFLKDEGVRILKNCSIKKIENGIVFVSNGEECSFDKILVAVGRKPSTEGFEQWKVLLKEEGGFRINPYLQTPMPNIWACGDVTAFLPWTHGASYQAVICVLNALFSPFKKKIDSALIPRAIYTDPEIAVVGETESTCAVPYEVTKYSMDGLDRAIVDGRRKVSLKF